MHHRSFTTLLYTTFLISLSLSSQANADKHRSLWSHRRRADGPGAVPAVNFGSVLASTPSSPAAPSSSSTPAQFVASTTQPSSASPSASSTTQQQQQQTTSSSSSQQQSTPSPPSSSTPSSSSQQSTAPASTSAQSQVSSPSQTPPSASSPSSGSTAPQSSAAPISQPEGNQGALASNTQATNGAPSGTIASNAPTSTNSSGSNKSFFENKALVAGTFSVAGLLAIACVISCGMWWARRRNARRDFDDDQLFFDEKQRPFSPQVTRSSSPEREPEVIADDIVEYPRLAYGPSRVHPAHMYPPQAYASQPPMQHMNVDVGDGMAYYGQPVYAPQQYGIEFPPNAQLANPHDGPTPPATTDSLVPAALRPSVKHQSAASFGTAL